MEDPINRSRSCEETSLFEVLDEINGTISQPTEKFSIGSNKRVRILPSQASTASAVACNALSDNNVSTQSTRTQQPNSTTTAFRNPVSQINVDSQDDTPRNEPHTGSSSRPAIASLKVARKDQTDNDTACFYVTPFTPEQNENDLRHHIHDIVNIDSSQLKVTKLVPRGKKLQDLSFVSFKVTVTKTASQVVGDPWYWPEGITVRLFESNKKTNFLPVI